MLLSQRHFSLFTPLVAPVQSVSQAWTTTAEIPTSATHPITTTPATTTLTTRAPTVDPNTKRPLPLGSLICTVQTPFAVTFRHVPPDGMCSIILAYPFYTYLGVTLDPEYYEHDGVQNILDVAAQQKHTEYGIGIDFDFCRNLANMETLVIDPRTKTAMDLLWSKRVYHYGQVNPTDHQIDLQTPTTNCARGLKRLLDLINDKTDNVDRPSYTIYSYPLFVPENFAAFGGLLSSTPVDIFIAEGYHAEEDTAFTDCRMIPPTLLSKELLTPDLQNVYPVRLANTIWSMTVNPAAWSSTTSFAVSIGMSGRWYRPRDTDSDPHGLGPYQLGKPCASEQRPDIQQQTSPIVFACTMPSYNKSFKVDTTFQAVVGYDKVEGWLFTFDSAETLRKKVRTCVIFAAVLAKLKRFISVLPIWDFDLCEAKSNVTALKLNIVAANIGSEDYTNQCGLGPLSRLRMLKALSLYFAHNYTSSADKSKCLQVNG
ncbi:uncharacterized protein LOC142789991 [Rhipicephalus microplus]|uniref:uncharacterized protein LOC142789991 n=1 Tax=Rhipicephalus microplus TaxID=6941 RepID=UPI003F6B5DD9